MLYRFPHRLQQFDAKIYNLKVVQSVLNMKSAIYMALRLYGVDSEENDIETGSDDISNPQVKLGPN